MGDGAEWPAWLDGAARERLERDILPGYLPARRWFAGKTRAIDAVTIADAGRLGPGGDAWLVLADVRFRDGGTDRYFLPLVARPVGSAEEALGELDTPGGRVALVDATQDDAACAALLDRIEQGERNDGRHGTFLATPTAAFAEARGPGVAPLAPRRATAEQSNSAVMYGDRLILKLFRRLEPGLNPELEIGRFLSERTAFDRIPRTAGTLEYDRPGSEPAALAILQGLVANEGTGWEYALDRIAAYYQRAEAHGGGPPGEPPAGSLLDLAGAEPPAALREHAADALEDAATLGRRTAELHRALASVDDDPAFRPEAMGPDDLKALGGEIREQVEKALAALRETLKLLPADAEKPATLALSKVPGLLRSLDELPTIAGARKIRVHGDYHLGQVLRTGRDFIILDFEGEPAKSLAQRRAKHAPFKDVAGMLRSFDYAAWAGLFAFAADRPGAFERLAPWARAWQAWASAAFLRGYLDVAGDSPLMPADRAGRSTLLRAFLLDKALYELLYELNNRPDWVRIPLQGILALIEPARDEAAAPGQTGDRT